MEQIIEIFPHSTFPKQQGEPYYDKMQKIFKLAATNAASVEKNNQRSSMIASEVTIYFLL